MENFNEEERYLRAKKRVDKLKGFYTHLIVYVIVNAVILLLIYSGYDSKIHFWNLGSFSTALGWGIGLAVHALVVFGPNMSFLKQWEENKLDQFKKEEEQHNTNQWE